MNKEQFERESHYQVSMSIARQMLKEDLISEEEYNQIREMMIDKYNPIIGNLESSRLPKWDQPKRTVFIDEHGNEREINTE